MTDPRTLSRRTVLTGAAGLAAGAAIAPFPRSILWSRAVAQEGSPAPAAEQVLRWGAPTPMERLSVVGYGGSPTDRFMDILFMPPFQGDATGALVPGVCTEYMVSEDGLVYTFAVDPEAKFSDGSKITAGDIKFTWEYMATPESGNPFPYYQTQAVAGHDAVRSGAATDMSGLVALDDETLQITLSRPYSPFLAYCTQCLNGIHQRKNIEEGEEWDRKPTVSSGPYVIDSFDVDSGEMVMVRNPFWWREQPAIERIEVRVAPDPNTLSVLWGNDEIDIQERSWLLAAQYQTGPERESIVDSPMPILFILLFKTTLAPMDDINVRRALLKAIDIETLIPALYRGAYLPATSLSSPAIPGYVEQPSFFDPEGAKAALAESAYGSAANLPPVTFSVGPTSPFRLMAEAIQQGWQDILGISPAILPTDPGFDPDEIGANVRFDAPGPMFLDAGGFTTWAFKSDNNYFRWIEAQDAEIDGLIEQAEALAFEDTAGRAPLYQQAERLMVERGYMAPLAHGYVSSLVKPWVVNAAFRPDSSPIIESMYIAER